MDGDGKSCISDCGLVICLSGIDKGGGEVGYTICEGDVSSDAICVYSLDKLHSSGP